MSDYTKETVFRGFLGSGLTSATITKHFYKEKIEEVDLEIFLCSGDTKYFSTNIKDEVEGITIYDDITTVEDLMNVLNMYIAEVNNEKEKNGR